MIDKKWMEKQHKEAGETLKVKKVREVI